jgi:molecular chaperone HscA
VDPEQVEEVVMIGGVSRIPFVKQQVEKFFQREVSYSISPEQAVALGTARIAHKQATEAAVQVT